MQVIKTNEREKGVLYMIDAGAVVLIYGFVLFVISLKFLKDPKEKGHIIKDLLGNHAIRFIAGLLPLIFGLIILLAFYPVIHDGHMEMLAGVLGGILLLIGLFRLWFCKLWCDLLKKHADEKGAHLVICLLFIVSVLLLLIGGGIIPLK